MKKKTQWDVDEQGKTPTQPKPLTTGSIIKTIVLWILVGIACGSLGLAVVVTLYIAAPARTTTTTTTTTSVTTTTSTTTTSTTTTTSSALPAQCFSYTTISDSTRSAAYTGIIGCDTATFTSTPVWVRFVGSPGTMIPHFPIASYYCGTHATGWFASTLPSTLGSSTTGTVCYNWSGNTCSWSNSISVTNCSSYYVYELIQPSACSSRYCTV